MDIKRYLHILLIGYFLLYSSFSLAQMHCLDALIMDQPEHCADMHLGQQKLLQEKLCDMQCSVFKTVYQLPVSNAATQLPQQHVLQTMQSSHFLSLHPQPLLRPPIQVLI